MWMQMTNLCAHVELKIVKADLTELFCKLFDFMLFTPDFECYFIIYL